MIAVKVTGLSKESKEGLVLKDINIELEYNGMYGIVGDNFSGRLELLKIISGLLNRYKGEVSVLGSLLKNDTRYVEDIGIAFGIDGFIEEYTGFKNLKIIASIKDDISDEDIKDALYIVGLSKVYKEKVNEYSFEERKRLSIAQAIMEKPSLIIIDEPFMYIQEEKIEEIASLLKDISKSRKTTIILGSRKSKHLKSICSDLFFINKGKITLEGKES